MVLYIYKQNEDGGRNVIFDIEFYLKDDNFRDGRLWYSELHVCTMVKNLLIWYKNNQHNFTEETEQEFFNDIHEIDNLRGWLWEKEKNWAVSSEKADKRHYHDFLPKLRKIIGDFANKYGFETNED